MRRLGADGSDTLASGSGCSPVLPPSTAAPARAAEATNPLSALGAPGDDEGGGHAEAARVPLTCERLLRASWACYAVHQRRPKRLREQLWLGAAIFMIFWHAAINPWVMQVAQNDQVWADWVTCKYIQPDSPNGFAWRDEADVAALWAAWQSNNRTCRIDGSEVLDVCASRALLHSKELCRGRLGKSSGCEWSAASRSCEQVQTDLRAIEEGPCCVDKDGDVVSMARDPALLLLNSVLGVCWAVFAPAFPWLYHWLHKTFDRDGGTWDELYYGRRFDIRVQRLETTIFTWLRFGFCATNLHWNVAPFTDPTPDNATPWILSTNKLWQHGVDALEWRAQLPRWLAHVAMFFTQVSSWFSVGLMLVGFIPLVMGAMYEIVSSHCVQMVDELTRTYLPLHKRVAIASMRAKDLDQLCRTVSKETRGPLGIIASVNLCWIFLNISSEIVDMDVNGGMEADLRLMFFQLGEIIVCLQVQASVNRQCTRAKNAVNALNMELLELSLADVETSRMEPGELDSLSRSINLLHTFMRDANRCQGVGVTLAGVRVNYQHLLGLFSTIITLVFFVTQNVELIQHFNDEMTRAQEGL